MQEGVNVAASRGSITEYWSKTQAAAAASFSRRYTVTSCQRPKRPWVVSAALQTTKEHRAAPRTTYTYNSSRRRASRRLSADRRRGRHNSLAVRLATMVLVAATQIGRNASDAAAVRPSIAHAGRLGTDNRIKNACTLRGKKAAPRPTAPRPTAARGLHTGHRSRIPQTCVADASFRRFI